jgi:hypothetical protein
VTNKAFQTAQPAKRKGEKDREKGFLNLFEMANMDITIKSANA